MLAPHGVHAQGTAAYAICPIDANGGDWLCQPSTGQSMCAYQLFTNANKPMGCDVPARVFCPDADCRANQANYLGDVIDLDINSRTFNNGSCTECIPASVTNAADCCTACRKNPRCNVWSFCTAPAGCSTDCDAARYNWDPALPNNTQRFGQFGACSDDGSWPVWTCTLRHVDSTCNVKASESGVDQPWVGGVFGNRQ
ncbi:hypothetical protein WJX72_007838 [[Myrmecia] bisecta]|uniref:Uncharacterized protein n=1 Tax=[Myrmecia] bisecta TaxID=41462 RepID=A0AAW1Q2J2_9CHLO